MNHVTWYLLRTSAAAQLIIFVHGSVCRPVTLWCMLFFAEGFQEIPSSLKYSRLQFYYPSPKELPKTFAWLTEPGIFYGEVSKN